MAPVLLLVADMMARWFRDPRALRLVAGAVMAYLGFGTLEWVVVRSSADGAIDAAALRLGNLGGIGPTLIAACLLWSHGASWRPGDRVSLRATVLAGLTMTVPALVALIASPAPVAAAARGYLAWVIGGGAVTIALALALARLRREGQGRTALTLLVAGCALNVVLLPVLVLGDAQQSPWACWARPVAQVLGLEAAGVSGAGAAAMIPRTIALVAATVSLWSPITRVEQPGSRTASARLQEA